MKPRSILMFSPATDPSLRSGLWLWASLLGVVLLVGCAPATAPVPMQPVVSVPPTATATELPVEPSPLPTGAQPTATVSEVLPMETPTEVPQPIATSRGPDLEATDPATVRLDSGELQLVEFFRYT